MAERYRHLFIRENKTAERYKAKSSGGGEKPLPERERVTHGARLLTRFNQLWQADRDAREQRAAQQITTREGSYISFISADDHELVTKSLERLHADSAKSIRLMNVKTDELEGVSRTTAVVYIPHGMEGFFIKKIADYQNEEKASSTGKPKNDKLVRSIEDVSLAVLETFWIGNPLLMPDDEARWCEVWLYVNTREEKEQQQIASFKEILAGLQIDHKENSIVFPERAVLLIRANRTQLVELMMRTDLLAELRPSQEPAGFWINESAVEQQEWVEDLAQRLDIMDSTIKVCILDTGVNNAHQLLQPLIDDANTLTVEPAWLSNDHSELRGGHGTLMAGVAGYGNLEAALTSGDRVALTHKLCSVKILPPPSAEPTPRELWGDKTAQGVFRAETQNPQAVIVYCLAVTSEIDSEIGRPSSWSGAVDKLAYGEGENQRLIIISAGNCTEDDWANYPDSNYLTTIQNPAQAWNAITVGAYTEKTSVNDPAYNGHTPLAGASQLSPYSATSLGWESRWPIKPDVVFEGGNVLKDPDGLLRGHADLELLSTSARFNPRPFETLYATSAAAAQAAWFAAKIAYQYPYAWPETIRALMVHSAEWNDAMINQTGPYTTKRNYRKLLRVFGYGNPNLDRALYSQESALTFVSEESIQPYGYSESGKPETNQIHFYNLPWPKDILLPLANLPVRLKITLSYFIEPGAGEIGWKDKYRYASHGLRFDVNNVGETEDEFRKRVNVAAREEDEQISPSSGSGRWYLGMNNRSVGSIHSDFWNGTAAELATCNLIAVYPTIGWWRERKNLNRVETSARYSLIISLDTPSQDVELYTTVSNLIGIPVEIVT